MIKTTYDKNGKICCIHQENNGHNCKCHNNGENEIKISIKNEEPLLVSKYYPDFCEICNGSPKIYSGVSRRFKKGNRWCFAGFCSEQHQKEYERILNNERTSTRLW